MKEERNIIVNLSIKNLGVIILILIGLVLLWKLQAVFFMLFFAFIISSSLRPLVDKLESKKIPRLLSVTVIFIVLIIFLVFIFSTIIAQLSEQLGGLIKIFPTIMSNLSGLIIDVIQRMTDIANKLPGVNVNFNSGTIEQEIEKYFKNIQFQDISNVFSNSFSQAVNVLNSAVSVVFGLFTVLMLSLYMLVRKEDVYTGLIVILPKHKSKKYALLIKRIEENLGNWLRGQFTLMIAMGFFTWLVLTVPSFFLEDYNLHKFALPLAFIAALLEVIPNFGPIITSFIGVIIAAGMNAASPVAPVTYLIVMFTLLNQIENIILVPKIMQKSVGLDPIITIVSFIAAAQIFNILGVLLIIPLLAVIYIIIQFNIDERAVLKGKF